MAILKPGYMQRAHDIVREMRQELSRRPPDRRIDPKPAELVAREMRRSRGTLQAPKKSAT
jgi:hypothetical protein